MRPDGADIIFGGAGIDTRAQQHRRRRPTTPRRTSITTDRHRPRPRRRLHHGRQRQRVPAGQGGASGTNPTDVNYVPHVRPTTTTPAALRIVPRAMQQLDYTLGGATSPAATIRQRRRANGADNGAADLIHGESGDDYHLRHDRQRRDLRRGPGRRHRRRLRPRLDLRRHRPGRRARRRRPDLHQPQLAPLGEPLYGIAGLLASDPSTKYTNGNVLDELISTPGTIQSPPST